mmetsp:Transcript_16323/g.35317  ORF Transcript_16323/g.35317 Transcript_16323/m.35317 type:complete len:349 (-) Transcript_16323:359-1405(-)
MHPLGVIDEYAVVSQQVLLPRFHRRLGVFHPVRFHLLHVRLGLHPIQILVQPVHEVLAKLLAVVLVIVVELRREAAHRLLQQARRQYRELSRPNVAQEGRVGRGDPPPASEGIVLVDLLQVFALQEVLRDGLDVVDALQYRIHVARISQVVQPHRPGGGGYASQRLPHESAAVYVVEGLHYLHGFPLRFHGVVERGRGVGLLFGGFVSVHLADLLAVEVDPPSEWWLGGGDRFDPAIEGVCILYGWRREGGGGVIMYFLRNFHQDLSLSLEQLQRHLLPRAVVLQDLQLGGALQLPRRIRRLPHRQHRRAMPLGPLDHGRRFANLDLVSHLDLLSPSSGFRPQRRWRV